MVYRFAYKQISQRARTHTINAIKLISPFSLELIKAKQHQQQQQDEAEEISIEVPTKNIVQIRHGMNSWHTTTALASRREAEEREWIVASKMLYLVNWWITYLRVQPLAYPDYGSDSGSALMTEFNRCCLMMFWCRPPVASNGQWSKWSTEFQSSLKLAFFSMHTHFVTSDSNARTHTNFTFGRPCFVNNVLNIK